MQRKEVFVITGLLVSMAALFASYFYVTEFRPVESGIFQKEDILDFQVVVDSLPQDFSLSNQDAAHRQIFLNLYEGLVNMDAFFRTEPGLAYTWGNIDEEGVIWEFKLRPNVQFHNGEVLTVQHIEESFQYYEEVENQEISLLLASIKEIRYPDEHTVHIETRYPDPLLLQRLRFLFILPLNKENLANEPIGTGPYQIVFRDPLSISMERFDAYWGRKPRIAQATFYVMSDVFERMDYFLGGEIDILAAMPPQVEFISQVEESDVLSVLQLPSLEMVYLMFNIDEFVGDRFNVLSDEIMRDALTLLVDREALVAIPHYAHVAEQYVSSGVFGYDTSREELPYDIDKGKALLGGKFLNLRMALPESYRLLGEAIRSQLDAYNISVELEYFADSDSESYLNVLRKGRFQMYLIGHKFDVADGVEFFRSTLHSPEEQYGIYNGTGLQDVYLDDQIKRAERVLDTEERQEVLFQIQEDTLRLRVGLPLFELDRLFGVKSWIQWQPRMDGYILLREIN